MLAAGKKLGPYEIVAKLGEGGMGEVYKARDTRLDRAVAVKILPDAFAADPQLRERFDREARVVSQLTHPHICTLYDVGDQDGVAFLVMECLEGETLESRLARTSKSAAPGLPLDEALAIAVQIADALDKAHRAGVVHRDLKPGNIMLTRSGAGSQTAPHAKLLDFGLAKTGPSAPAVAGMSMLPTTPPNLTAQGTILGTFQYMSPEQLEGADADARSDIYAFGLIVFEMVTGRKVFEGKSQAALIAAILEHPPARLSSVKAAVPQALETIVQGCLAKDPDDRWQSARDVLKQLKGIGPDADAGTDSRLAAARDASRPASTALRVAATAAAVLLGAAAASGYWFIRSRSSNDRAMPMHVSLALPPGATSSVHGLGEGWMAMSPDGRWIIFPVVRDGKSALYLRDITQSSGKVIEANEAVDHPFFSPDSRWIGFVSGGVMKKVPVSGGLPVVICPLSVTSEITAGFVGASWGADDTIVFVPQFNAGIWTVPAAGGEPRLLLKTDEQRDRIAYNDVHSLPGKRGVLFEMVPNRAKVADDNDIAVLEAGAAEPRMLFRGGHSPRYSPSGHLLFARGDALLAAGFDLSRLEITGTPVPILDGLEHGPLGDVNYDVSQNGTLVYEAATGPRARAALAVIDRKGGVRPIADGPGLLQEFSVSPDGRSVAARVAAVNDDIWTYDIERGSPLRLTFEPGDEIWPQWSPDGTRIAFGTRTGRMFLKASDGTGQREEIARGELTRQPTSFAPDGKMLAFTETHPTRKRDILLLPLDGARTPQPLLATDADEWGARFSPDGHRIAYVSDETGRNEIFVVPIGSPGGRKRVSSNGGASPAWARNGRELFFLKGTRLAAVALDAQGNASGERIVLEGPTTKDLEFRADSFFDVLPDGERFVMLLTPRDDAPTHYNLVINWFEEIRRRMSSGK